MFPRSFSPPASMPAVENFRTPKPVNIRNRTSVGDRGNGPSNPSSESFSNSNHNASNPDGFSSRTRLSLESVHSSTSSNGINNMEEPTAGHLEPQIQYPQNSNPCSNYSMVGQLVSYSGDRRHQYNNICTSEDLQVRSDAGRFHDKEVMETGAFLQSFSNHGRVAGYHHTRLTDTDKLQQFSNLMGYSTDGAMEGSVLGRPILDTDQMKQSGGHQVSPAGCCLTPEPSRQSLDCRNAYTLSSSDLTCYHDLTGWLQQHRQHLRQQQLANNLPSQGQVASLVHYPSMGNVLTDGSDRMEMLKQAADDIIKAKDSIIERQKVKIAQLETSRASSVVGSNLSGNRSSNEQLLEKKLGAAEYELREVKRTLQSNLNFKDDIITCLSEKIKEKDSALGDLERKCMALKSEVDSLQKEIACKERYLSDLPTPEEHYKNVHLIKSLKEDSIKHEDVIAQLEKKLQEIRNDLQSKDLRIQLLEESITDLKRNTDDLKASNKELLEQLSSKLDLMQLQQLQKDNRKLTGELENTKKFLDVLNNQLQQQSVAHKTEIVAYKERLDQEAAAVTALQQQIREKEQLLKNYKQTVKEITVENQNLTEKNLKQEEELKELQKSENMEEQRLQQQLMKELSIGLCDLQSLVKICLERANGQDPNLAALLGIRDFSISVPADSITQTAASISVNSLKHQLSKAKDLRHEIDKLREIISDKFAEDMSRRLTCNPQ